MQFHHKLPAAVFLSALLTLVGSPPGAASDAPVDSDPPPASTQPAVDESRSDDQASREDVLDWLDQYLSREVLFRQEDIDRLRAKIGQMSPPQLQQWLDQTREIRETLESDQWKSTEVWLEGYLPTKIYSDQEMEQFRQDVGEMSPSELSELLKRIQQKHDTLQSVYAAQVSAAAARSTQAAATAKMQSQSRMNWLRSFEQNQVAARNAASQRNQTRSTRPLYGQTQARAASRHSEASRRYNQPLITSRQAAQITVDRAIYGGLRVGW
jgi:membrane-associated HD superfamily phosphohydrolase